MVIHRSSQVGDVITLPAGVAISTYDAALYPEGKGLWHTDAQRAALDTTDGAYWGSVDDYQRKMTARQLLRDGGITPGGDEPAKPAAAKAQYLSLADNVVSTKPAAKR